VTQQPPRPAAPATPQPATRTAVRKAKRVLPLQGIRPTEFLTREDVAAVPLATAPICVGWDAVDKLYYILDGNSRFFKKIYSPGAGGIDSWVVCARDRHLVDRHTTPAILSWLDGHTTFEDLVRDAKARWSPCRWSTSGGAPVRTVGYDALNVGTHANLGERAGRCPAPAGAGWRADLMRPLAAPPAMKSHLHPRAGPDGGQT